MCSYFGPGNFSIWSVAILLQVSPDLFTHHHPHAPPLCGLGGGAFGTPHLYWLTPTYPGLWVVDWCQFEWGSVSRSSCTNIGPAGSNTFCTDWTFLCTTLKTESTCAAAFDIHVWNVMHIICTRETEETEAVV